MKKRMLVFVPLLLLFYGCGETKENMDEKKNSTNVREIEMKTEIDHLDSLSSEIEEVDKEIQESVEELEAVISII